jgi:6-phosphogluconolactonase (cycloisomerase 2 family)
MKIGSWVAVAALAVTLLSGCKGFWNTTTTSTGTTTGSSSGTFYVLNQKTSQIAAFSVASGAVKAISGSPYALSSVPFAMAISPNSGFLYVSTAAGIYLYSIGSTGALTLENNGAAISADPAYTMQVDPSGSWLIEAVSGGGTLNAIPLVSTTGLVATNSTGGTEQEQTVALPSLFVQQLAISPGNSTTPYVFVAMGSGGTAAVPFTATNTNPFGTVSTIALKNTAGAANAVAVDPTNRLLYVGETVAVSGTQTGGLRVFSIGSTLAEVTGSPYATGGTGPSSILATASYVYVANKAVSGSTDGNITGFAITSTGTVYSLTSVNTISAGASTVGLAEDNTSTYLMAVNSGGTPDLSTFTFDTTTAGKLDASVTGATGTDPVTAVAIAALP